jgi:U3 small nucleolar RNA-associated protein 21
MVSSATATATATASRSSCSRLYAPHRALGVISDGTPLALCRLGRSHFATSSLGRAFLVYQCDGLQVSLVSRRLPPSVGDGKKIRALASRKGRHTFLACGRDIAWYQRLEFIGTIGTHPGEVTLLLCVGDWLVTACDSGRLKSWGVGSLRADDVDAAGSASPAMSDIALPAGFVPSAMCHPPTYLNKVVIGSRKGSLLLCNVRTGRIVHSFGCMRKSENSGSSVTAVQPSPVLDVTAVGTATGAIHLVHLRKDTILFSLSQPCSVTSLSFRTDAVAASNPSMVSTGEDGIAHVWDLEKRRLLHNMRCHEGEGGISFATLFEKEPILITTGASDNSIRMWVFDAPDGSARLLRQREGHMAPPRIVRYYGASATVAVDSEAADPSSLCVLSAGEEGALRVFHTVRDCLATELSQKALSLGKKSRSDQHGLQPRRRLKPAISFAVSETRSREWCDIVSCHDGDSAAYVWRFQTRAASKVVLRQADWETNPMMHPDNVSNHATSVAISACGNYGFVGTKGGTIYRYNMQSGLPRGSYPTRSSGAHTSRSTLRPGSVSAIMATNSGRADPSKEQERDLAPTGIPHAAQVTGLVTDALNEILISSGLDGRLSWWCLTSHRMLYSIEGLPAVSRLEIARDAELVAAACDDGAVRVYDIGSRQLVRRLIPRHGAATPVNDMCFTADCRRLVAVGSDGSLRVWDLPTGRCVDWMVFSKPVVSVTCSPSGEFLCTCHAGRLGISVWADRSFFQPVYLDAEPTQPILIDEPNPEAELDEGMEDSATAPPDPEDLTTLGERQDKRAVKGAFVPALPPKEGDEDGDQRLSDEEIVLSLLPRAYWSALYNLEDVKDRNRPVQPPSKPAEAPFFLPTLHKEGSVDPSFAELGESKKVHKKQKVLPTPKELKEDGDWEGADAWEESDGDGDMLDAEKQAPSSRILVKGGFRGMDGSGSSQCHLARLLLETIPSHVSPVMEFLKGLGPSAVDVEMSQLCQGDASIDPEGPEILRRAMDFFSAELVAGSDFDVLQAYIHRFFKLHAETIMAAPELRESVVRVKDAQLETGSRLKRLIQEDLCLLQYLRDGSAS